MRALTLDYRRAPLAGWAGLVLLAAGIACAALAGTQYARALEAQALAEAGMRAASAAARGDAGRREARTDPQRLDQEIGRARKLLVQLGMPWEEMFAGVEAADSRHVGLLRIETDVEKRSLRISAEARSTAAMLKYVHALEAQPAFMDVFLQSHQVQQQDAQHPVRFVVTASWRAAGTPGT